MDIELQSHLKILPFYYTIAFNTRRGKHERNWVSIAEKAMDGKDKERMMELEASIHSSYSLNIISPDPDVPLAQESGPAKKRRRCAVSKIVQSNDLSLDSGRSLRSKKNS
jgi:hypothetical protein